MARRYYSSIAQRTTLASSVSDVATTMVVNAAVGFPASTPYTMIIDQDTVNEEVVTVTGRSGTTLTVTRGVDGTTAVAHSTGASVNHGVSARDFDEPNAFINGTDVVSNDMLVNDSITINGSAVALGGSVSISGLPSQTGNAGKYLKTDGTTASWAPTGAAGGGTDQVFYENDQTVTTNYTITTNKNAVTAGPVTINSGVTVTIPSGSYWSVV